MKLLVIIPYRNRDDHLSKVVPYLSNKFLDQNIDGKIVISEQNEGKLFNRGMICNIGFDIFSSDCDYVCFHDVDMICDNIDYSYSDKPTCLIKHRTKNPNVYNGYFGGIVLFPKNKFVLINGFSNNYWGWGAEDDDLYKRCKMYNIETDRRNGNCNDLEIVTNDINRKNNYNYKNNLDYYYKNKTLNDIQSDGLSNLKNLYKIISLEANKFYTKIKVDI